MLEATFYRRGKNNGFFLRIHCSNYYRHATGYKILIILCAQIDKCRFLTCLLEFLWPSAPNRCRPAWRWRKLYIFPESFCCWTRLGVSCRRDASDIKSYLGWTQNSSRPPKRNRRGWRSKYMILWYTAIIWNWMRVGYRRKAKRLIVFHTT